MPRIFFNSSAGQIEGRYLKSSNPGAPLALVLHPNPLYGGNMNNKVVYNLYKTLAKCGFTVLCINFRGVGLSHGSFDHGTGELIDAASALDWLQVNNPTSNYFLVAGFSFGAWIGMQVVMRRPEVSHYISIAPPVDKFDFSFLFPCPVDGLMIQGDRDSITKEERVMELAEKLGRKPKGGTDYRVIHGADHFFRNKMDELSGNVEEYLLARKDETGAIFDASIDKTSGKQNGAEDIEDTLQDNEEEVRKQSGGKIFMG